MLALKRLGVVVAADADDGGGADVVALSCGFPRLGKNELAVVLADWAAASDEAVGLLVVNMLDAVKGNEAPAIEGREPPSDGNPNLGFIEDPPIPGALEACPAEAVAVNGFGLLIPVSCDLFWFALLNRPPSGCAARLLSKMFEFPLDAESKMLVDCVLGSVAAGGLLAPKRLCED